MRVYFYDLLGKRVVTADGKRLGRIADLIAERRGDALCITGMRLGTQALVRRVASESVTVAYVPGGRGVPWALVASVGREVRLTITQREAHARGLLTSRRADRTSPPAAQSASASASGDDSSRANTNARSTSADPEEQRT